MHIYYSITNKTVKVNVAFERHSENVKYDDHYFSSNIMIESENIMTIYRVLAVLTLTQELFIYLFITRSLSTS